MELKRKTKWSMTRRRYRPKNWFAIGLLVILVLIGLYVDSYIVPNIPSPFIPTPTATRSPESFVTEAQAFFQDGKLLQAIDKYKEALRSDPQDDSIYVSLAQAQVFVGLYEDAQASAEYALLLNPNNSMAHAARAWALDFQGKYIEAEDSVRRAIDLDPNNGIAHAYYAEILVDTGAFENLAKAAEESRVAVSLTPNTIETHRARGYVLEATGNYEEAILEYQAAIAINDNIPDLHLALGRTYRFLGVYEKAILEFTVANSLNPSDPTPDLLISRTYASIGEFAKATQYAQTAVNDAPTDPSLRGNYGVMLYRNVDWAEAVVQLGFAVNGGTMEDGKVIENIPISTDIRVAEYYYTYAMALARVNRCGEALQVAQLVLGRLPGVEEAVAASNRAIEICETNLSVTVTPTLPGALEVPSATPSPTSTP
jgi:tetratricopeptide (TPR) repeat protein